MFTIEALENIIGRKPDLLKENIGSLRLSYEHLDFCVDVQKIRELFAEISDGSAASAHIEFDDSGPWPHTITKDESLQEVDNIKSGIERELRFGDQYKLSIDVDKTKSQSAEFTVYDSDAYVRWMSDKASCKDLLFEFSKKLHSSGAENITFNFIDKGRELTLGPHDEEYRRASIIERHKSICNFEFPNLSVTPDDLLLLEEDWIESRFSERIRRVRSLLAVAYVANSAKFVDKVLEATILGETTPIDDQKPIEQFGKVFDLYHWIYTGGDVYDKAEIARIVIADQKDSTWLSRIDEGLINDIHDSYRPFLRKDIAAYVQKRIELEKVIRERCSGIAECVTGYLDELKSSLIALMGYVLSLIFVRSLSRNESISSIPFCPKIIIMLGVVALFFIVGIALYFTTKRKYQLFEFSLDSLREASNGFFSERKIQDLFDDNKEIENAKAFYRRWSKIIFWGWIAICALAAIAVFALISQGEGSIQYDNNVTVTKIDAWKAY